MFKRLIHPATLLILTQFFVLTLPVQSAYGLDTIETAASFYESGVSKLKLKDYRGAVQDFDQALKINPKYFEALYGRGISKAKLGDYKEAIQDYNKSLELNPESYEAFLGRGVGKISLGQIDGGCLDLSKAGELGYSLANEVIKKHCN